MLSMSFEEQEDLSGTPWINQPPRHTVDDQVVFVDFIGNLKICICQEYEPKQEHSL